jgi:hypothetical protein
MAAIFVQDQAFVDRMGPGEIIARANKDIDSIRTGLGERLGYLIWSISTIISAKSSAKSDHRMRTENTGFCICFRLFSQIGRCSIRPSSVHEESAVDCHKVVIPPIFSTHLNTQDLTSTIRGMQPFNEVCSTALTILNAIKLNPDQPSYRNSI